MWPGGFLIGVGPDDHGPHRRPLQPLLGGQLGALERRFERRVHAGVGEIDESFNACPLGGADECRHSHLVHLVDRGAPRPRQTPSDHGGGGDDRVDGLAGRREAARFGEVTVSDVGTEPHQRRVVGTSTYQTPDLVSLAAQKGEDPSSQFTGSADYQDHLLLP